MYVGGTVTLVAGDVLFQVAGRQLLGLEVDVANQAAIIAGGSRRGRRNQKGGHGEACENVC
jgi:hypothetical protein